MRQNSNHKRPRNRGNLGRKPSNNRNQTFDSNGPSVRIRGNAFQVHEKYLTLARDAYSSGDRVMAENYFQHAEHYYRIVNATTDPSPNNRFNGHAGGYGQGSSDDDYDGEDETGRPYQQPQGGGQQHARSGEPAEAQSGEAGAASDEEGGAGGRQGDQRAAERSGGERRRRGRRANGHDGGRGAGDGDDGRAAAAGEAGSEQGAPTAPAAAEPESRPEGAGDGEGAGDQEPGEKPRRRTRRRPRAAAEAGPDGPGRDGDEEPVLI